MRRFLASQARWIPWVMFGVVAALGFAAAGLAITGDADLLIVSFSAAIGLVFGVTGALVASRLPGNPIGWLFCAFALLTGLSALGDAYIAYGGGDLPNRAWVAWTYEWSINAFSPALIALSFLLFPTGGLPSARWRPLMWAVFLASVIHAGSVALAPGPLPDYTFENPAGIEALGWLPTLAEVSLIFLAAPLMLLSAASLFTRLRRSSGAERQQIKWFAYAAALIGIFLVAAISSSTILGEGGRIVEAASFLVFVVVISGIPAAMGVAILRYRLYDIDLIINRTLVYGGLTISLVLVYVGCVVTLQHVFRILTGGNSQLAVVASTLTIAALFSPLRRRIQSFIDRRFYRKKYDAAKTLEDFSAKLREETDLDALESDLVGVVRDTVQPVHISLWLREPTRNPTEDGPA